MRGALIVAVVGIPDPPSTPTEEQIEFRQRPFAPKESHRAWLQKLHGSADESSPIAPEREESGLADARRLKLDGLEHEPDNE